MHCMAPRATKALAPVWHLRQNSARIQGRQGIFICVIDAEMNYQPTMKLTAAHSMKSLLHFPLR